MRKGFFCYPMAQVILLRLDQVVCSSCSSQSVPLTYLENKEGRVCYVCFETYQEQQQIHAQGLFRSCCTRVSLTNHEYALQGDPGQSKKAADRRKKLLKRSQSIKSKQIEGGVVADVCSAPSVRAGRLIVTLLVSYFLIFPFQLTPSNFLSRRAAFLMCRAPLSLDTCGRRFVSLL